MSFIYLSILQTDCSTGKYLLKVIFLLKQLPVVFSHFCQFVNNTNLHESFCFYTLASNT